MRRTLLLCLLLAATPAAADEGLWTFDNFPSAEVAKRHGFGPDRAWLDRVRMASIRLSSCSASLVSPSGLVMTNHHCARSCVEDVSTPSRDLVAAGFQARAGADELRCPDEHADQLVAIEDVTARVGKATHGLSGRAFAAAQAAEIGRIEKACKEADPDRTHCQVVSLYHGGLYHLYRYRRWNDLRLVFAPEEAIAFFRGDPDNYEFPFWNLDVFFLRLYENGQPARTPQNMRWFPPGSPVLATPLPVEQPGTEPLFLPHPPVLGATLSLYSLVKPVPPCPKNFLFSLIFPPTRSGGCPLFPCAPSFES